MTDELSPLADALREFVELNDYGVGMSETAIRWGDVAKDVVLLLRDQPELFGLERAGTLGAAGRPRKVFWTSSEDFESWSWDGPKPDETYPVFMFAPGS